MRSKATLSSLLVLAFTVPALAADHTSVATSIPADTTDGPSYFQTGVDSSAQDKITFASSQGAKTTIQVATHQTDASFHFFWIAQGLTLPNTTDTIFVQLGYTECATCTAPAPFLYAAGSSVTASNGLQVFDQYPLKNGEYATFYFETDGVAKKDGNYDWRFYSKDKANGTVLLATLEFESKEADAPYVVSEVAGSSNACADSFSVQYGDGEGNDALMALKNSRWQAIHHGVATYGYGPCTNANVTPLGTQHAGTTLGVGVKQTTADGAQVW